MKNLNSRVARLTDQINPPRKYRWYQNRSPLVMTAIYLSKLGIDKDTIGDADFEQLTGIPHSLQDNNEIERLLVSFCESFELGIDPADLRKSPGWYAAHIIAGCVNET